MSTTTRILYIDEVGEVGGGGNSLHYLMRTLDRTRFEPLLLSPDGPIPARARAAGIRVIPYTFRKRYVSIAVGSYEIPLNPYRLAYRFVDACRILAIVRREGVSLVHTNNLDAHLVGWFLKYVFQIPVVWHIRNKWPRSFYRMPWPSRIIFVSDAVKDRAVGARNPDPRAVVVYNGIDERDFVALGDAASSVRTEFDLPDRPLAGVVGRITPGKRHDVFLRAAQLVTRAGVDVSWLIIGDEIENRSGINQTDALRALAAELGIADRVVFTGFRTDIARLVRALDVFVAPFDDDSNPRTVLEAMVLGRPIVGSRSGGIPAMLDDERAGLVADKGDAESFSRALVRVLTDRTLAATLGAAARDRACARYTIHENTRRIQDLYEDVLGVGLRQPAEVSEVPTQGV